MTRVIASYFSCERNGSSLRQYRKPKIMPAFVIVKNAGSGSRKVIESRKTVNLADYLNNKERSDELIKVFRFVRDQARVKQKR